MPDQGRSRGTVTLEFNWCGCCCRGFDSCDSDSRRRDRINLGLLRSFNKGAGGEGVAWCVLQADFLKVSPGEGSEAYSELRRGGH